MQEKNQISPKSESSRSAPVPSRRSQITIAQAKEKQIRGQGAGSAVPSPSSWLCAQLSQPSQGRVVAVEHFRSGRIGGGAWMRRPRPRGTEKEVESDRGKDTAEILSPENYCFAGGNKKFQQKSFSNWSL
ncbi:hypothetical protein HAX54_049999, partial [Datura stramonium]|nr:hypothetical protein [Datura stramonium]